MTSWVLQRVGCDLVLGSDATEDSCGVCKGNNSECTTHRGLYAKQHRTNREYRPRGAGVRGGAARGTGVRGVQGCTEGVRGGAARGAGLQRCSVT